MRSIVNESKKMGAKKLNKYIFADAGLNVIGKKIIKVNKSSEKGRILWKETTTKITSQEGGFLIFFFVMPLMTVGLLLMKIVAIPLAKSVLIPLGLSSGMSAADATIQNKNDETQQH